MSNETFIEKAGRKYRDPYFTVSPAMAGICLTVMGILNITTVNPDFAIGVDEEC